MATKKKTKKQEPISAIIDDEPGTVAPEPPEPPCCEGSIDDDLNAFFDENGEPLNNDMAFYKVICPSCGHSYHHTTALYDTELPAHPGMLALSEPYAGYGWDKPVPDHSAGYGCIECPGCGSSLAPAGIFKVSAERDLTMVDDVEKALGI